MYYLLIILYLLAMVGIFSLPSENKKEKPVLILAMLFFGFILFTTNASGQTNLSYTTTIDTTTTNQNILKIILTDIGNLERVISVIDNKDILLYEYIDIDVKCLNVVFIVSPSKNPKYHYNLKVIKNKTITEISIRFKQNLGVFLRSYLLPCHK